MLLGLLGAAVLAPSAGLLAGCGRDEPDPLLALAERAASDATKISRVSTLSSVAAPTRTLLTELAGARRAHASALNAAVGESGTDVPPSAEAANQSSDGADSDSQLSRVKGGLDDARQEAERLVLTLPRERASLVSSIAACCAAYRAVLS